MDSSDNRQRQQDEIVALQAIFGDGAVVRSEAAGDYSFELHAPLDGIGAQADIRFHLPATYPTDDPPVFEWIATHDTHSRDIDRLPGYVYPERRLVLSQGMSEDISRELRRLWDEDMCRDVAIFSWVSWLPEYLVFVAHVARVRSGMDVAAVRDALMRDKKIAQATHNILAYRIRLENGSICQDNDDDGETAAGKRLAHLLQLVEAEDVVVVVTRWFGGTHLGPDRFKLINNAARQALEDGGFLGGSSTATDSSARSHAKKGKKQP
ncbi:UPF0029-domain-containing protein [Martensiomyces pterosporus]|nr:UPF0029-domain-containing protein [Martensiomyces pterosporus]